MVHYSTDLFDGTTIDRLILQYERLLAAAVAAPEERALALPLLGAAERQQVLVEWNDTRPARPSGPGLPERFFAAAARWPQAEALRRGADVLTYGELERRVRRRAAELRARGVGAETVTALCLERSFEMVEAVLAVLAAGGAFVALDPLSTEWVLVSLLEQARPRRLLTQEHLLGRLPIRSGIEVLILDGGGGTAGTGVGLPVGLPMPGDPGALAYVCFTSGSTGAPKGILGTHGAVASYMDYLEERCPLSPGDRVLQLARLSFDASCRDLLYPLTQGASVVLLSDDEAREPAALLREARAQGVTCILSAVPSLLRAVVESAAPGAGGGALRLVLASGEPLPWELCRRVREVFGEAVRMANQYGPSETTLTATVHEVPRGASGARTIPAGRPIPGMRCRVLDPHLQEVPAGVVGQVFLGGAGVTRGYLSRPDLTAERFLPDPFSTEPGERLYATGDLGRLRPDGLLELQGRLDHQVKLRGIRVEPGEVEAALLALPGVREAVVVAPSDGSLANQRLIAYVAGDVEPGVLPRSFREQLRERLPDYMVPAAFVMLPALPRTPNGKVDRKALPAPGRQPAETGYVAPRTPLEEVLAGIWAELLDLERVGAHDDFFAIGGQSLLAAQLIAQVREIFPGELPLRSLFAAPTVAGLAATLLDDPARREQVERIAELMLEIADASEESEEVLAT
jgi:amino acid adenylation domain-containing protein